MCSVVSQMCKGKTLAPHHTSTKSKKTAGTLMTIGFLPDVIVSIERERLYQLDQEPPNR